MVLQVLIMRFPYMLLAPFVCLHVAAQETAPVRYKLTAPEVVASRVGAAPMKNADRGVKLKEMFSDAGCTAHDLQVQPVAHAKLPNINLHGGWGHGFRDRGGRPFRSFEAGPRRDR
jgi:hypothetical protein